MQYSICFLDLIFFIALIQEPLPVEIKQNKNKTMFGPANNPKLVSIEGTCTDSTEELGYLNTTLTKEMTADLARWKLYDENQNSFCDFDDEDQESVFVDLLLNPERFTGYKGHSAQRIWKTIYEENCFKYKSFLLNQFF